MDEHDAAELERFRAAARLAEHKRKMDTETPFEVRIDGGFEALKAALDATGLDCSITTHAPTGRGGR